MLVNTEKGLKFNEHVRKILYIKESTFDKIKKKNGQLNHALNETKKRNYIMKKYRTESYEKLEKWFRKVYKKQIVIHTVYNKIPRKIRLLMKNILESKKG